MTVNKKELWGLLAWFLATFAASFVGARASIAAKDFYGQLVQPDWAPPAWLFGPVWTLLFTLMAIAAWLVWREGGLRQNRIALSLFVVQLVLNALWSWLFFTWQNGAVAFVEILILDCAIAATLVAFWRIRPLAAMLLAPYVVWVSFAAVLNYALWQLNPTILG